MRVAAALLLAAAAPASAGTIDQEQISFNSNALLITTQSGAQTFTAGITGVLDQADLNLQKAGTPPTVTVEIRTASAGVPTATVLATGTIDSSAVGTTAAFLPVTFATPAPVTAGTQYALVAYSAGTPGNAVEWSDQNTPDRYAGGMLFVSSAFPPAANWNGVAYDFAFRTYVGPTPHSASTGQRASALKKCKKKHSARARRKCRKKANLLPV